MGRPLARSRGTASGCCMAPETGRSSCCACSRPGGVRWTPARICAATDCRRTDGRRWPRSCRLEGREHPLPGFEIGDGRPGARVRVRGPAPGVRGRRVRRQGAAGAGAGAAGLDARDRALAMRLAYGAVQRRGTLDHLIGLLAGRPPQRAGRAGAGGAAAGLLRAAVSARRSRPRDRRRRGASWRRSMRGPGTDSSTPCCAAPRARARSCSTACDDDTPERAAVKHSHPEWIARLWWEALGADDARALMACDNEPGEVALRANTLVDRRGHARRRSARARPTATPSIPEALVLEEPIRHARLASVARGRVHSAVARGDARRARRWTPSRASACSTCAPRRVARARIWRR